MEAPKEGPIDDEVDLENVVTLDLAFLFNYFLRDGNEIHLKVVKGIPNGAKAIEGGILDGSLIVVFDRKVPSEVWFKDLSKKESTSIQEQN